jgi:hypothetical protein
MNTMQDLRSIHELETLISQAFGILLQVDSAIKAMKPPAPKKKRMSRAEISTAFDLARKNARLNNRRQKNEKPC